MKHSAYKHKLLQIIIPPLLSCLPLAIIARPASATPGVLQVQQGQPTTLTLTRGYGANISFLATGEVINQIWLDDPSWVALDANGCLAGLGANRDCQDRPAQILHLRQIDPLSLPGLPTAPEAQLTVVTQTATGAENIHVFRIARGGDQALSYHTVEVVATAHQPGKQLDSVDLTAVRLGLNVATQQNWLDPGDTLHQRIQRFLDLADTQPAQTAAQGAGISLELVSRLEQLGRDSLSPSPDESHLREPMIPEVPLPRPGIPENGMPENGIPENGMPENRMPENDMPRPATL